LKKGRVKAPGGEKRTLGECLLELLPSGNDMVQEKMPCCFTSVPMIPWNVKTAGPRETEENCRRNGDNTINRREDTFWQADQLLQGETTVSQENCQLFRIC